MEITPLYAFLGMPGGSEMLIVLAIAVLLFGKRLPEVGRSLGKGIVEFKKGIHGIEEDIESASTASADGSYQSETADRDEPTAPKFEPPAAEPKAETDGD